MTRLGIDHAHIIGLSMGGAIAINFALAHPESTDTLTAVDPGLSGYQWQEELASVTAKTKAKQDGIDAAKAFWLNCDLFVPATENPGVASRLKQIVDDYSGWHFVNDDPASRPQTPAIDRLDTLTVPTLVVLGERDIPDFHCIADILAKRIDGAKKVVIPKAGHMANMEDPQRFNDIVLGFLANQNP
jgi:3-oxoadipate enol-lactonase